MKADTVIALGSTIKMTVCRWAYFHSYHNYRKHTHIPSLRSHVSVFSRG